MPAFSLTDYCGANVQAGILEVRLAAPPWPTAALPRLADFLECLWPGYRRAPDEIWGQKDVAYGVAACQSKVLTWSYQGRDSVAIAGWYAVATVGGQESLVAYDPFTRNRTLSAIVNSLSLVIQLQAARKTFS